MEQGLGSTIVDGALHPADVGVGVSETFGTIRTFPKSSKYSQTLQDDYKIIHFLLSTKTTPNHKVTFIPKPRPVIFHTLNDPIQNRKYLVMKREKGILDENDLKEYDHIDPLGGGHLLGKRQELFQVKSDESNVLQLSHSFEGRQKGFDYLSDDNLLKEPPVYSRFMDSLGGGHLLSSKKNVDSLGGGHLIKEQPVYSRFMDSLGGGHLIKESPVYSRFMDSLGGGHLLSSKKNVDSLGGGHLIKEKPVYLIFKDSLGGGNLIKEPPVYSRFMDSLGGGHLLGTKKDLDSLGGGHLIKDIPVYSRFMYSLGGGNLLSAKKDLDYLGGGHLIKEPAIYSRFMDSLGGGHLLNTKKDLDSLGGGHLIKETPVYTRVMDSLGGGHLIKDIPVYSRFMDSLGGGHLLGTKKDLDYLGGGHLIKEPIKYSRFMDSLGGGHLIREPLSYPVIMNLLDEDHILNTVNDLENDLIKDQTVRSRPTTTPTKELFFNTKTDFDYFSKTYLSKYPFDYLRQIFEPIRTNSQNTNLCTNCPYGGLPTNKESKPTKTVSSNSNVYQAKVLSVKVTPNKEQISSDPVSYSESKKLSYSFPLEEENVEVSQTEAPFTGVIDVKNLDISNPITQEHNQ
ncbi:hypothetical protein J6590_059146 [Homalodisca vitripennis]|nr:hypothetical protein J6590_059146 [Homalodisca vitripennis]